MCCRSRRVLESRRLWSNRIKKYHAQEMLEDVTAGEENIASSEVGHIYDNNGNDNVDERGYCNDDDDDETYDVNVNDVEDDLSIDNDDDGDDCEFDDDEKLLLKVMMMIMMLFMMMIIMLYMMMIMKLRVGWLLNKKLKIRPATRAYF